LFLFVLAAGYTSVQGNLFLFLFINHCLSAGAYIMFCVFFCTHCRFIRHLYSIKRRKRVHESHMLVRNTCTLPPYTWFDPLLQIFTWINWYR